MDNGRYEQKRDARVTARAPDAQHDVFENEDGSEPQLFTGASIIGYVLQIQDVSMVSRCGKMIIGLMRRNDLVQAVGKRCVCACEMLAVLLSLSCLWGNYMVEDARHAKVQRTNRRVGKPVIFSSARR